jgi:hypothetical protein
VGTTTSREAGTTSLKGRCSNNSLSCQTNRDPRP